MIVDKLENLDKYAALHPLFARAAAYLKATDLLAQESGTEIALDADRLRVIFARLEPKTKAEARLEAHRSYIDIQIPLSGTETMGYTPVAHLPRAAYDAEKDIAFFDGPAQSYLHLTPGMFAIFFPQDGHAPGITDAEVRKVIVKVLV